MRGLRILRRPNIAILFLAVFCLSGLMIISCGQIKNLFGAKDKIVVVMVDVSGSIPDRDWAIYEQSFEALLKPDEKVAKPGNRVVLGRISGQTLSNFIPDADSTFPKTGVKINDEESAERIAKILKEKFEELRQKESKSTNIFESLKIAEDIFNRDQNRKVRWLVILSDMVEESRNHNFKTNPPAKPVADKIIEDHKKSGFLPSLKGVRVYVIGAGGGSNYETIKNFWLRYLNETGALCDESTYGRSAITAF